MTLEIFTYDHNPKAWKALVAAQYTGAKVVKNAEFKFEKDNQTDDFKRNYHPSGKVPVLGTPEGNIFESNAIARYVARQGKNNLYGRSDFEAAQIDSWLDFSATEIEPSAGALLGPIFGYVEANPATEKGALTWLQNALSGLNQQLSRSTWLVGERVSLADVVLACALAPLYVHVMDAEFRAPFGNVNRWFDTCVNQKEFTAVFTISFICKKKTAAKAGKFGVGVSDAGSAPAKVEKKEKAAKAAPAKKEEKKEEPMSDEAPKPKAAKNPLDDLPKSEFVLDTYKKLYSNDKDIRNNSGPHLIDNLPLEDYTMFWVKYKWANEYKAGFMLANLCGGFAARMEGNKLHKYGFGLMYVTGEDGKEGGLELDGLFVWRGKGLPQVLVSEVPDTEQYEWTEIKDPKAEQEKILDFLECDGKFFKEHNYIDYKSFK